MLGCVEGLMTTCSLFKDFERSQMYYATRSFIGDQSFPWEHIDQLLKLWCSNPSTTGAPWPYWRYRSDSKSILNKLFARQARSAPVESILYVLRMSADQFSSIQQNLRHPLCESATRKQFDFYFPVEYLLYVYV